MKLFSNYVFHLVAPSDFETDPYKTMVVFAYFLGACDAFGQMHRITHEEKIQCFRYFLKNRFKSMEPAKREKIISYVLDANNAEEIGSFIQAGGQAIVELSHGRHNTTPPAPGLLAMLIHLGSPKEATQHQPNNAVDYNARGMSYAKLGQYQLAIEDYNEAIRLKPDYADALYNRVVAYDKLNQHQNKPLKII